MKLYHYYRSSASYRVRIALALKRLPWEAQIVDLGQKQQFTPEFARLAPAKSVPLLSVDGSLFAQSLAIIEYLDEAYGGPSLLPPDPVNRAYARELALDIGCEIHPLNNTRVLLYLEQRCGLDEYARKEWYRHWVKTGLMVVDQKMQRSVTTGRFCLGDHPTVAECFLVPQVINAKRFECDLADVPEVIRIFENCMAMDEFKSTHPSRYDPSAEIKAS